MLLDFFAQLCLLSVTSLGLGWFVASRLALAPAERIVASVVLSLLGVFFIGGICYVAIWPTLTLWLTPLLAAASLILNLRTLTATLCDPVVRALLLAQFLVTAWCLGWLSLVVSYSGGGWSGDWFEHWERARFLLDHGPLDYRFLGAYAFPARPPLANLVTSTFLAVTRDDFAHYQLISTFLSSLVFLPAALIAHRYGGIRTIALLAVFFAVSPLFVQNATFAWTKLPTACCVLTAFYFFLRSQDPSPPRASAVLFSISLATGLLVHYSAGPAAVVFAGAWLVCGRKHIGTPVWWRTTAIAALTGILILSAWFVWSLAHYGVSGTVLSNSSVTSSSAYQGSQLFKIFLNFRDTIIPHFLRPLDPSLIVQRNPWSFARDWFFQIYQLNLPLAFGSVASVAIARETWRAARAAAPATRNGWTVAVCVLVVLSIVVQGERDHWGLAHICLQSLVLLGLAFLAARWPTLSKRWQRALIAGSTLDFIAGIALHFAAQNFALGRWFARGNDPADIYHSYNQSAFMNLVAKTQLNVEFISDLGLLPPSLTLACLALIFTVMVARAHTAAS
jgi:hypothetical protein